MPTTWQAGYPDSRSSPSSMNTEGALAKTAAGFEWDVTHPESGYIQDYLNMGAIQPWDTSLIPNFAKLNPVLEQAGQIDGKQYEIALDWGYSAPLIRSDHSTRPSTRTRTCSATTSPGTSPGSTRRGSCRGGDSQGMDPNHSFDMTSTELEDVKNFCIEKNGGTSTTSGSNYPDMWDDVQKGNVWATYAWPDAYVALKDKVDVTSTSGRSTGTLAWVEGLVLRAEHRRTTTTRTRSPTRGPTRTRRVADQHLGLRPLEPRHRPVDRSTPTSSQVFGLDDPREEPLGAAQLPRPVPAATATPTTEPGTRSRHRCRPADVDPRRPSSWSRHASSGARRGTARANLGLLSVPVLWLVLFFLVPVMLVGAYSVGVLTLISYDKYLSLQAWRDFLHSSTYLGGPLGHGLFWKSMKMSLGVSITCVLLAYPVAYMLALVAGRRKYTLLLVIITPFLTRYLLRVLAWRVLLNPQGVIQEVLRRRGGPGRRRHRVLAYNSTFAVYLVLAYAWVPFVALPIFVSLESLDLQMLEASSDLGASRWTTFRRVTLPMSMPGVIAAFVFVFIPTIGEYVTPQIVGGKSGYLFGNVIQSSFAGELRLAARLGDVGVPARSRSRSCWRSSAATSNVRTVAE